jgi:hypothetical protein
MAVVATFAIRSCVLALYAHDCWKSGRMAKVATTGQAYLQHGSASNGSAFARVRNTANDQASPAVKSYLQLQGEPVGLSWVFPVSAGQQTFVLEAYGSPNSWAIGSATLTGTYVPFGYDGGTTLAP